MYILYIPRTDRHLQGIELHILRLDLSCVPDTHHCYHLTHRSFTAFLLFSSVLICVLPHWKISASFFTLIFDSLTDSLVASYFSFRGKSFRFAAMNKFSCQVDISRSKHVACCFRPLTLELDLDISGRKHGKSAAP